MADPTQSKDVTSVLQQLRQFFHTALKWSIMSRSGPISPGFVNLTADGNEHAVDANAAFLVSRLNFKNRVGNAGTLTVGTVGNEGISLLAGEWVSPPWTYPSQWYYKITGSASTDVYECWWAG